MEYAHAHATNYDLVWWIAAEEPTAIPDQFAALAARFGLEAADPAALRSLVHEELRRVPGWLLIFDNAGTTTGVAPWLPPGPWPADVPGHVLITTRRGGFSGLGRVLSLDVMPLPDAVARLRTRILDLDGDTGEQIAGQLGQLPLALEQAAAYLDQTQMPPVQYLDLLRSRAQELYRRGKPASRDDTRHLVGYQPGSHQRAEPGCGSAAGHLCLPRARAHPAGRLHRSPRPAARPAGPRGC